MKKRNQRLLLICYLCGADSVNGCFYQHETWCPRHIRPMVPIPKDLRRYTDHGERW